MKRPENIVAADIPNRSRAVGSFAAVGTATGDPKLQSLLAARLDALPVELSTSNNFSQQELA